jgi:hypothetical protein
MHQRDNAHDERATQQSASGSQSELENDNRLVLTSLISIKLEQLTHPETFAQPVIQDRIGIHPFHETIWCLAKLLPERPGGN